MIPQNDHSLLLLFFAIVTPSLKAHRRGRGSSSAALFLLPEQITEATWPKEHSDAPRAVMGQSPMCRSVPVQWNMCLQTCPLPFPKGAPLGVERATPHLSCWQRTWASSMSQWELQRDPHVPRILSSTLPSHGDLPWAKRTSVYPERRQGFKKMSVTT